MTSKQGGAAQVVFEPGEDKLEGLLVWEASVVRDQVRCKQVKQRPGDGSKQVSAICRTTSSVADCPPLGLQEE